MKKYKSITFAIFLCAIIHPHFIFAYEEDLTTAEVNKDLIGEFGLYCPTKNIQASSYYNTAIDFVKNGNVDKAIFLYLKAIDEDPSYCDAMDNLGRLYRVVGKYNKSINWYKKSISIHPDNPVSRMNLGVVYRLNQNHELAIEEYQHLIRLNNSDPEGYFGIGQVKLDQNKNEEAIEYFSIAEKYYYDANSPLIIDARKNIALAHYMSGNFSKSAQVYQSIYEFTKDDPAVNYMLGACFINGSDSNKEMAKIYFLRARDLGVDLPQEVTDLLGI